MAVCLSVAAASCSASVENVSTTQPATSTTATTAAAATSGATAEPLVTTTTAMPLLTATLALDEVERLATRGGVSVAVSADGRDLGRLSDAAPELDVEVPPGTTLELRYIGSDGSATDVRWQQPVAADATTVAQPWRSTATAEPSTVVAWQRPGELADRVAQIDAAAPLTVTSPLTWFVSTEGDVVGSVDTELVVAAHERGLDVWPALAGLDADALHLLLADAEQRSSTAERIAADAAAAGVDGVNIDLEGYRLEDASAVTSFVGELAELVHAWGGVVSYDLVPRTDDWDVGPAELSYWSTAPERRELAAAVDYTVLMAYDQHNGFRSAGPVAAPNWVEEAVIYMLRYADPGSVLLGVPAYGRLWDPEVLDEPRALSLGFFDGLDGERIVDPDFGMDRIELEDGMFYWADNEVESERIAIAAEYGLAGWAVWRLGLDDAGLWSEFPPAG